MAPVAAEWTLAENGPLSELKQVVKTYESQAGTFSALKGVNLSAGSGEFHAIVGKPGSGKSTLINMISGIDRPTSNLSGHREKALHDCVCSCGAFLPSSRLFQKHRGNMEYLVGQTVAKRHKVLALLVGEGSQASKQCLQLLVANPRRLLAHADDGRNVRKACRPPAILLHGLIDDPARLLEVGGRRLLLLGRQVVHREEEEHRMLAGGRLDIPRHGEIHDV